VLRIEVVCQWVEALRWAEWTYAPLRTLDS
jgi:hypothetical protein